MKRRDLLRALPAVAVVAAVPGVAMAEAETPIALAYRQALDVREWLNDDTNDMDEPHWQVKMQRLLDLQNRIASLPPTCSADWAMKIMNADDCGTIEGTCGRWADLLVGEARKLIAA